MAARFGEREMERVGAPTVSVSGVVGARFPDVPATLNTVVPIAAELSAIRVSTLLVVVVGGLKEPVTPGGKPEADRLTLPLKPFWPATVIVVVILPP